MISKQAEELVRKLESLKLSENKEGKKSRVLFQNIKDYDTKMKKYFVSLDQRIVETEKQYKILREHEKEEEEEAIKKIDQFQMSLKNLLNSYSNQARQANKKLDYMYEAVKEQMKNSFKESITHEQRKNERYKIVCQKLERMIDYVRDKQKYSIDQYEKLKELIRIKSEEALEINKTNRQELQRRSERLAQMFERLENKINSKLSTFTQKSENHNYQINKIIHLLIQQVTSL